MVAARKAMDTKRSKELATKISQVQSLMIAYVTDGRTREQPAEYRRLYEDVTLSLEEAKYANPNPHKSLELFWAYCGLKKLGTYAERRAYVDDMYADVLLDLARAQRRGPTSKSWSKANDVLADKLAPIRAQWLKAKNFIYSAAPDYENSVKESINSIESCLMVLLNEPNGTLGKLLKRTSIDPDIERLISQAYGYTSNRDFVRHGGTIPSSLTRLEAEFFLDFAAACIIYLTAKLGPATNSP